MLRFEGEAFVYRRRNEPQPKMGPYLAILEAWLEAEQRLPARDRRRAQRLYEALCLEGFSGSSGTVRRHVRAFESRRHPVTTAFILQSFDPGEAHRFDWSHEVVQIGGIDQWVMVAHMRLCYSL